MNSDTCSQIFYNISEYDAICMLLEHRWIAPAHEIVMNLLCGGYYEFDNNCFLIWLRHSKSLIELTRQELLEHMAR